MSAQRTRVIGLMSGTSHDAIDAAAVDISVDGDTLVLAPLGIVSAPYAPALRQRISDALPPAQTSMAEVCRLDTEIGQAFADVAERAQHELCGGAADLVVSHGQTMYHWVDDGAVRGTLQLGQPAWIAERTGCTVVADLRSRDIASGGQGAPLVSLIDALWLQGERAAAVNLGGIANATLVSPDADPLAFDIGPANALIDAAVTARTAGAERYDREGAYAARGSVDQRLLQHLLTDPYYRRPAPKSTGKELFNDAYLDAALASHGNIAFPDLVATLTALTAHTVADALRDTERIVCSGGGTENPVLMAALRSELRGSEIVTSDELGLPSAMKEALAFAVLGFLTVNHQTGALPSCTGAQHGSVLGSVVPGRSVEQTLFVTPRRLRIVHP